MQNAGFSMKATRIYKRSEFLHLYKKGKRASFENFRLIYIAQPNPVRFALVVGKKVGNAVLRNRIRRILRAELHSLMTENRVSGIFLVQCFPFSGAVSAPALRRALRLVLQKTPLYACPDSDSCGTVAMHPSPSPSLSSSVLMGGQLHEES
jgi:ribonuclease P protein component